MMSNKQWCRCGHDRIMHSSGCGLCECIEWVPESSGDGFTRTGNSLENTPGTFGHRKSVEYSPEQKPIS